MCVFSDTTQNSAAFDFSFQQNTGCNWHKFFRNWIPRQCLMYSEIQDISDINQQYSKQTHYDQWCTLGSMESWVVFLAMYARMRGHISKCNWINTYEGKATICDPAGVEINELWISTMVVLRIQCHHTHGSHSTTSTIILVMYWTFKYNLSLRPVLSMC